MRTVFITEIPGYPSEADGSFVLDLTAAKPKDCIGCWSCWVKTPGRCVHSDLDEFYRALINADKAVFYLNARRGFVSGNVKTLFDRLIPFYLPYIRYGTGESMHEPRYEKYPDADVYYTGDFLAGERQIFEEYLARAFYQFYMNASIQALEHSAGGEEK